MNFFFQIWGEVSNDRLTRTPPNYHKNDGQTYVSLDVSELKSLGVQYREFLWTQISEEEEWDSTTAVFEYLAMDVVSISIGGVQQEGASSPEWALDVLFDGCGGMAEVSSLLAAHWAQIWYQKNKVAIDSASLVPFGFAPTTKQPSQPWPPFVPVGGGSYVAYQPERRLDDDDSPFQLNCSLADSLDQNLETLFADLATHYGELIKDGQCRCQLCMPSWNPNTVVCQIS